MTILIDKSQPSTRVIVTVSEVNPVTTGSTLVIINTYTNHQSEIALPVDGSPYPNRYNDFTISASTYSGLSEGSYSYKILDSTSATTETGLLRVVSSVQTIDERVEDTYIIPDNDGIEYITYE